MPLTEIQNQSLNPSSLEVDSVVLQSQRLRRLRQSPAIRKMLESIAVRPEQLIAPYFLISGQNKAQPISSMPNVFQYSVDNVLKQVETQLNLGVPSVMLFGVPENKDVDAFEADNPNGLVQQATVELKKQFGTDVVVFTDTCLCEYTSHGHCGLIEGEQVENDSSVARLAQVALSQARAGADFVCPSDMMDGRVGAIRETLDAYGYTHTGILAYAVKYASCFYGPFREAAQSAPSFGDRKTYQMDYRRDPKEALLALQQCEAEGADMVMVKPALAYLDIVKTVSENTLLPTVAYCVSGEYAMMQAAVEKGWLDGTQVMVESLYAIQRAGAQLTVSYDALNYAKWFKAGQL